MSEIGALGTGPSRRQFLAATAGATIGAGLLAGPATAQAGGGVVDLSKWFANTENDHELVDRRGESEVVVAVGAEGNGGPYAFDPPALRIDPGTAVVWERVGDEPYDVADPELGYHSEQVAGAGHRLAVQFDGDGLSTYECTAYGEQGMRGVVVGQGSQKTFSTLGYTVLGGSAVVLGTPMLYALREHVRDTVA